MSDVRDKLLHGFEIHSVEMIQEAIASGIDPNQVVAGRSPITELIEMYFRSPRFSECLRCLVQAGADFPNKTLLAVLLDDAVLLSKSLRDDPEAVTRVVDLRSAFTPLHGASLLHVAAEYGLMNSATTLIEAGADVEAKAAVDQYGFNGHTPIFHTVCQHRNHSQPILKLLLAKGARTDIRLSGITWGKSFEWETVVFDATPISYAQAGLLPQFQRSEIDVYANIRLMIDASGRPMPENINVPNAYLTRS